MPRSIDSSPRSWRTPSPHRIRLRASRPPSTGSPLPVDVRATPIARRLAAAAGVELADVAGSGRRGQIRKADVEARLTVAELEFRNAIRDALDEELARDPSV